MSGETHAAAACRLICRAQTVNTGMLLRLAVQRGEQRWVPRSSLDREPNGPSRDTEPVREVCVYFGQINQP